MAFCTEYTEYTQGYSDRINSPEIAKYKKNSKKYAFIFLFVVTAVIFVGMLIYSSKKGDADIKQAAMAAGGFFVLSSILALFSRNQLNHAWDGTLNDKKIIIRNERYSSGDDHAHYIKKEYPTLYFKTDDGKKRKVVTTLPTFNHYSIGDKVRKHKGFAYPEKLVKYTQGDVVCICCGALIPFSSEKCPKCRVPAIK